jgi:hypothetical protein
LFLGISPAKLDDGVMFPRRICPNNIVTCTRAPYAHAWVPMCGCACYVPATPFVRELRLRAMVRHPYAYVPLCAPTRGMYVPTPYMPLCALVPLAHHVPLYVGPCTTLPCMPKTCAYVGACVCWAGMHCVYTHECSTPVYVCMHSVCIYTPYIAPHTHTPPYMHPLPIGPPYRGMYISRLGEGEYQPFVRPCCVKSRHLYPWRTGSI